MLMLLMKLALMLLLLRYDDGADEVADGADVVADGADGC
jgi:hypothetical protein